MISAREENDILEKAYVPEHAVSMMKLISKGEPFLTDGYLSFAADNWAIVIGYPLQGSFRSEHFSRLIADTFERLRPDALWFIAPEPVVSLAKLCHERESDYYYTLIRRFKRKWGGVPSLRYEFFGRGRAGPPFFEALVSKL